MKKILAYSILISICFLCAFLILFVLYKFGVIMLLLPLIFIPIILAAAWALDYLTNNPY